MLIRKDRNVMVNFKPGEYTARMFIRSVLLKGVGPMVFCLLV